MEIFCVYNHFDPGQKIRKLLSPHSAWDSNSAADDSSLKVNTGGEEKHSEFVARKGDFPDLHCDPDELVSDLDKVFLKVNELLEKSQLRSSHLDEIHDQMMSLVDEKVNLQLL